MNYLNYEYDKIGNYFQEYVFSILDQGKQSDFLANKQKNDTSHPGVEETPLTTIINNDVWHMAPVLG